MKNSFNIEVCFKDSPIYPYEWDTTTFINHIKLERVSTSTLKSILTYEGRINRNTKTLLLSDTKNAIVIRLSPDGKILKRSFLTFDKELDVCEFAFNLKETHLECEFTNKKVEYSHDLSFEIEMKDYIIDSIKKSKDEELSKYLYYLYFDEIEGYSKDRLIKSVKESSLEKNLKLYNFLIES